MGGAGRMNGQTARVTDVRNMVEQLEGIDEILSGLESTSQLESNQATVSALQYRVGTPLELAGLLRWMNDLADLRVPRQKVGHGLRVAVVLADAKRQGLESLNCLECTKWRHSSTNVALQDDTSTNDVGDGADSLRPNEAMVAGIRLRERERSEGQKAQQKKAKMD